jgi:hypothetical protein
MILEEKVKLAAPGIPNRVFFSRRHVWELNFCIINTFKNILLPNVKQISNNNLI